MSEVSPGPQGFSVPEAARRLSISQSSVYRLIDSGQLRRVKIGHRAIIPASELERLLDEGADIPEPAAS